MISVEVANILTQGFVIGCFVIEIGLIVSAIIRRVAV